MKKLILLFCLTLASISFSDQGDSKIEVFFGGDTAPKYKNSVKLDYGYGSTAIVTETYDKKDTNGFGFEFGGEYRYEIIDGLELGAGLSYQRHPKAKSEWEYYAYDKLSGQTSNPQQEYLEGRLYDSIPLYLTAKYNFKVNSPITPFLKADLGYSINRKGNLDYKNTYTLLGTTQPKLYEEDLDYKIKNGMYYGVGAGITYNQFNASVNYKVNTAKYNVESRNTSTKVDYSRVTLQIGYNFGL